MTEPNKQWLLKMISGPHQGAEISLNEGKALIGSDDECDVVLHDVLVAPQHLELEFTQGNLYAAPLGGRVYINGKRIRDARQQVPSFAFISVGGSHLVVGPQQSKWPLLSQADIPDLEKDAPEAPATETPVATAAVESSGAATAATATPISPERRRAAWFGVALGCIMLVAWLILWTGFFGDLTRPAPERELTFVEKAVSVVDQLGLKERIEIEDNGGRINATGYVDRDVQQREVQALLREKVPNIRIRIWSLEKVLASTRAMIAAQRLPLSAASLQEGEVKVYGVLPSQEDWDRVRQLLLTEVPGLSGIEDQVRIESPNPVISVAKTAAPVQAPANSAFAPAAALPTPVIVSTVGDPSPRSASTQQPQLPLGTPQAIAPSRVHLPLDPPESYASNMRPSDSGYQNLAPSASPELAPLPVGSAPGAPLTEPGTSDVVPGFAPAGSAAPMLASRDQDATVVAITPNPDGLGWMKISSGGIFFRGGQLPVGGTVSSVEKGLVSITRDGKKRELRLGDRLMEPESLQTLMEPKRNLVEPIP